MINHADELFKQNCKDILENGVFSGFDVRTVWEDSTPATYYSKFAVMNRYDLSKEFPISTLRYTNWKNAIDEILWIFVKQSNNVEDLNSKIWDQWADESGTIGKAYGYQIGKKNRYIIDGKEVWMNQIDKVIYDIKNNPSSRRIMTNIYNFEDLSEMNLYPCAYGLTFSVKDGKLNAMLNQRSQDTLVANNWNVVQYAALTHMIAQVCDLEVGEFVHVIADMHIYDRHIDMVKEMMNNPSYPAPKFTINKDIKNFYDFTIDDFNIEGYEYTKMPGRIPVAI